MWIMCSDEGEVVESIEFGTIVWCDSDSPTEKQMRGNVRIT